MKLSVQEQDKVRMYGSTFFTVFAIVFIAFFAFKSFYSVSINNTTHSLPEYFYIVDKGNKDVKRNDYIEFVYHSEQHMYFPNGAHMVKILAGVPGDKVEFIGDRFFINNLPYGKVKSHAKDGQKLTPNVTKILGEDEYFVFAPHPDSFDSRYIYTGYISKEQIYGKVVAKY